MIRICFTTNEKKVQQWKSEADEIIFEKQVTLNLRWILGLLWILFIVFLGYSYYTHQLNISDLNMEQYFKQDAALVDDSSRLVVVDENEEYSR